MHAGRVVVGGLLRGMAKHMQIELRCESVQMKVMWWGGIKAQQSAENMEAVGTAEKQTARHEIPPARLNKTGTNDKKDDVHSLQHKTDGCSSR